VKLVLLEDETAAVADFVRSCGSLVTSRLAFVEVARAVKRVDPSADAVAAAAAVLRSFVLVDIDPPIIRRAASLVGELRSQDAIHLATALTVGAERMLVYDRRLGAAAEEAGIPTVAPGT
jgi:predicted nucleic acid-binding protein